MKEIAYEIACKALYAFVVAAFTAVIIAEVLYV